MKRINNFGIIRFHIKNINSFDEITKFRLILLSLITLMMEVIMPVISQFYYLLEIQINKYMFEAASIIAFFGILKKIGIKLVKWIMNNFSFSKIFLMVIIFDIMWILSTSLYFVNPKYMVWFDSIVAIFHTPFIFAFSISLNNYINYFYPNSFTRFQNYKNDIVAEVGILGLIISMILSSISIKISISFFIIGMLSVFVLQVKYYKKFKKYDFRYMLRYQKSLKIKDKG